MDKTASKSDPAAKEIGSNSGQTELSPKREFDELLPSDRNENADISPRVAFLAYN